MKQGDMVSGGVIFLFGALTVILSLQMPIGTFRAAGSGLFPLCLGILLMVLSALYMLNVLRSAKEEEEEKKDAPADEERGSLLPVVAFLAILALATLFLTTLGYPVVSFLLMLGLLRVLGSKRWPLNLAVSLVTAAGSHIVFVYLLKIPLPKGFPGI